MNKVTYKNYETVKRQEVPDCDTLARIADILQVSIDALLGRNHPAEIPRNVLTDLGFSFKRNGNKYEVTVPKGLLKSIEAAWKDAQERGFNTDEWDKAAFTAVTVREEDFPAIIAHCHKYDRYCTKDKLYWPWFRQAFRRFVFYMSLRTPGLEEDQLDSVDFFIRYFYSVLKVFDDVLTFFVNRYDLEHPGDDEFDFDAFFKEYATRDRLTHEVEIRINHERIAGLCESNIFSELYRRYGKDVILEEYLQGLRQKVKEVKGEINHAR